MWGEPRALNAMANALYVLAFLLVLYATGTTMTQSPTFSLRAIRILGHLEKVNRDQIVDALQGRVRGTFFTADIGAIRSMFETIPWVRRAQVRRYWPNRLEVTLEEHVPLARWGQGVDARLVNTYGEVFSGHPDSETHAGLPRFEGPAGSEQEVARRHALFGQLLAPIGLQIHAVALSHRRSWSIRITSGLTIQLGRDRGKDPIRARLARFVEVYPNALKGLSDRLEYVDLRYLNGFALRVPEMQREEHLGPVHGKA
ncbi:MAG: hypothetical protein A3H32_00130 [Betaproteobacteria bacterium RIFCSPLOWO2_02_FULL_63_19]|nr:MAG: hypothetical protein A3H32_00130 [Betaproteobacteria bacterium RIFCSPLOWO2_02_FULL_63_19]